jgi:DNA polymerase
MKRNPFEEEDELHKAIALIGTGDYDKMHKVYDNPLAVIGDCIRSTICAAPKHKLTGADFSNIEGRVTAWVAGEKSKLDIFRQYDAKKGPDPYLVTAGKILHKPPEQVTKVERQKIGKPAELGFGYQGGVKAFRKFAPDSEYTDEEIQKFKLGWRASHPNIERFWASIARAAIYAVRHPGDVVLCGPHIKLRYDDDSQCPFLVIQLPSGRHLSYPHARFCQALQLPDGGPLLMDHPKGSWGVCFKDNTAGQWRDVRGYGGLWTENIVQAIARDLLAEAMLRLDAAGFPIILHVHDEAVIESPSKSNGVKKFERLMSVVPAWGAGIPVVAKAWENERYVK